MGMQRSMRESCSGFAVLPHVASHECQSQSRSQGLGSWAVKGTTRLTQGMEEAMDVQMADVQIAAVQCDPQPPSDRVQVVPKTPHHAGGAHGGGNGTADAGLAWPHRVPARRGRKAKPQIPLQWSAGRRAAIGACGVTAGHANHQALVVGSEAKYVHDSQEAATTPHALPPPRVKQRDSESLQAELAAARWAWLGPTLLVRVTM